MENLLQKVAWATEVPCACRCFFCTNNCASKLFGDVDPPKKIEWCCGLSSVSYIAVTTQPVDEKGPPPLGLRTDSSLKGGMHAGTMSHLLLFPRYLQKPHGVLSPSQVIWDHVSWEVFRGNEQRASCLNRSTAFTGDEGAGRCGRAPAPGKAHRRPPRPRCQSRRDTSRVGRRKSSVLGRFSLQFSDFPWPDAGFEYCCTTWDRQETLGSSKVFEESMRLIESSLHVDDMTWSAENWQNHFVPDPEGKQPKYFGTLEHDTCTSIHILMYELRLKRLGVSVLGI